MSIRSLISKATAKKITKSNKRGAMLIMTLLVLMFALIFCMSAIMMTTWTRDRYYDSAVNDQARLTVTSYAEALYQAIYIQEISDEMVKALAVANATVEFSNTPIPGGINTANSFTVAKFSRDPAAQPDGSWYYYIDVTTTILEEVQSVRIYLKLPPPVDDTNLFAHTVELGQGGNLGQFNIGANAGGATDNTVFIHNNANMADTGSTTIYSDVISTGVITLGSGMTFNGDLVFLGPNAGLNANGRNDGRGRVNGTTYFITPDASSDYWTLTGQTFRYGNSLFHDNGASVSAATSGNPATNVPFTSNLIYFYNSYLNAYGPSNGQGLQDIVQSQAFYTNGSNVFPYTDAGGHYDTINTRFTETVASYAVRDPAVTAAVDGIRDYMSRELYSNAAQQEPTPDEARAMFGIPATAPAGSITINSFTTSTWQPGNYVINSNISMGGAEVTIDLSQGSVFLYVNGNLTIDRGRFNVINGAGSPNDFFIVLSDGSTLTIGQRTSHNASDRIGIFACPHVSDTQASRADSSYIPHCYIYGASGNSVYVSENTVLDAYVGLFGDTSNMELMSSRAYYFGRIRAANIVYGGGDAGTIDYCMGPDADEGNGMPVPVSTQFTVERFYYYYGDTPTA